LPFNFGNLSWYKSNFFENFQDFKNTVWTWSCVGWTKVICFKIRFCSTCLYCSDRRFVGSSQSQYCKCELSYIALSMIQFQRTYSFLRPARTTNEYDSTSTPPKSVQSTAQRAHTIYHCVVRTHHASHNSENLFKVKHKFHQWVALMTTYVIERNFLNILVSASKTWTNRSGTQEEYAQNLRKLTNFSLCVVVRNLFYSKMSVYQQNFLCFVYGQFKCIVTAGAFHCHLRQNSDVGQWHLYTVLFRGESPPL